MSDSPTPPPTWVAPFLAALATSPNVTGAARAAGIARQTAYERRESDPEFAAAWDDALEQAVDHLAGEMYRRAVHGTEKPVFQGGEEVGRVREYSDTLAIFLAKAHRPAVYGDRSKVEHSGPDGGPVQVTFYIPDNSRDNGRDADATPSDDPAE